MNALVINLSRREDRWEIFISRCPGFFSVTRVEAIDAIDLNLDEISNPSLLSDIPWKKSKAEIACLLSHHKAWSIAKSLDQPCCIFEDDAYPYDDFSIKNLPTDFDVIYLGFRADYEQKRLTQYFNHEDIIIDFPDHFDTKNRRMVPFAFSYIISPKAASYLCDCFDSGEIEVPPTDHYIDRVLKYKHLYTPLKFYMCSRLNSDIQ
jgi:GR25 family glycosyltransferase involved in LPS biosynthesis